MLTKKISKLAITGALIITYVFSPGAAMSNSSDPLLFTNGSTSTFMPLEAKISKSPIGLEGDPKTFDDTKLKHLVNLAYDRKIEVIDLENILYKLTSLQGEKIAKFVEEKKPLQKPSSKSDFLRASIPLPTLVSINPHAWDGTAWGNQYYYQWASQSAASNYFLQNQYDCDSDPDTDFVFHFNMAPPPPYVRWTSLDSWIYTVLWSSGCPNCGGLKDFGNSYSETNICLGNNTVSYAGGSSAIHNNLRIYKYP